MEILNTHQVIKWLKFMTEVNKLKSAEKLFEVCSI